MNPLNYATLPASKKLVEAKIAMETEAVWALNEWPITVAWTGTPGLGHAHTEYREGWRLVPRPMIPYKEQFPAPSFTEVWRELPQCHTDRKDNYLLTIQATIYQGIYRVGYYNPTRGLWFKYFEGGYSFIDDSIDLLIWLKQKEKGNVHR